MKLRLAVIGERLFTVPLNRKFTMTPTAKTYAAALESIITAISNDPGLKANVTPSDLAEGIAAARNLNLILAKVIDKTGVNADGVITMADLEIVSDAVQADTDLYGPFARYHGDDESASETGFHLLQNDGGVQNFQGRNLINTVIDAIYHFGFPYYDDRFVNEDFNPNELVVDVAGWLNFFLNGENRVYGTDGDDELGSGSYSTAFAAAADEIFDAGSGDDFDLGRRWQ